jgi:spermidine synthase
MPKGIFGAAIFLSAFLLFWVQPLFSKMVLPLLGGSPSVWNTAMMFFQLALLAGYGYAHLLTHRVARLRSQIAIHGAVIVGGLFFLPFAVAKNLIPPTIGSPIPWLVGLLAISVGWPFFALAASAPLVQAWFARSGHRQSDDPYFLYAASNSGSLLALLAFPVLFEPMLTLAGQARAWMFGFGALILIFAAMGVFLARTTEQAVLVTESPASVASSPWRQRLTWVALAFVPSSLLLGVTTYITTDIASAPLLWVVPLGLYLLSFIIAFARQTLLRPELTLKAQAIGILVVATMVTLVLLFERRGPVFVVAGVHLLTFFVTAVLCHTELARRRPGIALLTEFYFCMSIGGALGGVFNALVAPLLFSTDYEYYLALVGACALRALIKGEAKGMNSKDLAYPLILSAVVAVVAYESIDTGMLGPIGRVIFLLPCAMALYSFTERPFRFAFGVAAMIGSALLVQSSVDVLLTERNFFGINRVKLIEGGVKTALIHGTTMHGTEFTAPNLRREPLAYYARSGPIGQMMALGGFRRDVAAIGLGSGALACYRKPGERWTFFEIDGAVEKIARDTRGRLSLKASRDHSYDLIIVDAFSSDSIPMHLLTREALRLYLSKLKSRGVILFDISNEYLDLAPVLTTLVKSVGAVGRHQIYQPSPSEVARGASASEWMAIAASDADLDFLRPEKRWQVMSPGASAAPWTDDFSNIIGVMRW